jgi:hypothetical protein
MKLTRYTKFTDDPSTTFVASQSPANAHTTAQQV